MSSKRIKKWYLFSQTPESDMLLNPLDYFLWNDVEKRMARSAPKTAYETLVKFKERLRRTALATSPNLIRKAMLHMKKRIAARGCKPFQLYWGRMVLLEKFKQDARGSSRGCKPFQLYGGGWFWGI